MDHRYCFPGIKALLLFHQKLLSICEGYGFPFGNCPGMSLSEPDQRPLCIEYSKTITRNYCNCFPSLVYGIHNLAFLCAWSLMNFYCLCFIIMRKLLDIENIILKMTSKCVMVSFNSLYVLNDHLI